ncbi:MAG: hypothetical protein RLZZ126_3 [Pseudomonadota bacterium]|jgi:hypothetical protein
MQGYITLATGSRFYLDLAMNLVLSLKLNDPSRPVCVVTDRAMAIPESYRPFIDHIAFMDAKPGFHGCLNKLRMNEVSPFDESMFVDSDCILLKKDMDRQWAKLQGPGFSSPGTRLTTGRWYGFEIADVIKTLGIDYMCSLNSGVFYFRQGTEADRFFATALDLVEHHKELLGSFHRNKLQLADEPFIGAALGKLKIPTVGYVPEEGSIQITTIRATGIRFDPFTQTSQVTRYDNYRLLGRFFPRTRVQHSPSFAHFVKLKPEPVYQRISDQLREHFGLPKFMI